MLKNLKNFFNKEKIKIGDTVLCINDDAWNRYNTDIKLIKYKVYPVKNIIKTKCCNMICLDIGAKNYDFDYVICPTCKKEIIVKGIHYAKSDRFIKFNKNFLSFTDFKKLLINV